MGALNYAQVLAYNRCAHLYTHIACRSLIRPGHMIEGFVPPEALSHQKFCSTASFDAFKFKKRIGDNKTRRTLTSQFSPLSNDTLELSTLH